MIKRMIPICLLLVSCAARNVLITEETYETTDEISEEVPLIVVQDSALISEGLPPLSDTKITLEELKLYSLIMYYRKENNLPVIPLSKSLTYVAQQHCYDLVHNKPDIGDKCNAHSWSDKGIWKSCCYTPDHAQAGCIWSKPAEITTYTDYGFEIACGTNDEDYSSFVMTADYALKSWMGSTPHNNVILNKDVWADYQWGAIGIGIYKDFSVVWFGASADAAGEPLK